MFNKQLKINIDELDLKISKLSAELEVVGGPEYEETMDRIRDLTEIRVKLADSRASESLKPTIVSGLIGIAGVLLVLNYEKTDIVTSKAFGMATKLFKGV